ncbi:MAG: nuclear transport factor 2 family protein [Candidatus Manganitrophaceae bacterium]
MDGDIEAVRKANEAFYHAFEKLDIQEMDPLWIKEDYIKCIHPGWEARIGWQEVRDGWVLIFNHTYEIKFSVSVIDIVVQSDWAWVVCQEMISTQDQGKWVEGRVLSTNLFERRDGQWLLIHHHGSPLLVSEERDEEKEEEDSDLPMIDEET